MCVYCDTNNTFSSSGLALIEKPYISIGISNDTNDNYYLVTSEYKEKPNMIGLYGNSPFRGDKVKINFCPMCGKPLKNKELIK